jgi:hypothetical protein
MVNPFTAIAENKVRFLPLLYCFFLLLTALFIPAVQADELLNRSKSEIFCIETDTPAATIVQISAGSAIFSTPDPTSNAVGIVENDLQIAAEKHLRVFTAEHPLAWYNNFYCFTDGNNKKLWVSDEIGAEWVNGQISIWQRGEIPFWRSFAPIIFMIALVFTGFKLKESCSMAADKNADTPDRKDFLAAAFVVLLRCTLLSFYLTFWHNLIAAAADDTGYFAVTRDLMRFSIEGPWNYTLGLPLLYLPFAAILNADQFYAIARVFDHFGGFFIAPAAMATAYFLLRKLSISRKAVFTALVIWAVWPFAAWHLESWKNEFFIDFFALPPISIDDGWSWWRHYAVCINAGFNAMSDTPALLFTLLAALVAISAAPGKTSCFLAGALWGFASLTRINCVIFLPFFIYIAWIRRKEFLSWYNFFICGATALAGFLIVFGFQFYINCIQFGSPMTFGYCRHYVDFAPLDRPDAGFTFHTLAKWSNLRFLALANHRIWCAGFAALLFMKNRKIRDALIFLSIPLIIFFAGYSHTYCDARRFIFASFTAFAAAFATADLWQDLPSKKLRTLLIGAVAVLLIFCQPLASRHLVTLPFVNAAELSAPLHTTVQNLLAAASAAIMLFAAFTEFKAKRFRNSGFILFILIYFHLASFAAAGVVLLTLMIIALASVAYDAADEIKKRRLPKSNAA